MPEPRYHYETANFNPFPQSGRVHETDSRTVMLDSIRANAPRIPLFQDWRKPVHAVLEKEGRCFSRVNRKGRRYRHYLWGDMLNNEKDALPDCTVAAPGHMLQTWTANTELESNHDHRMYTIPDRLIYEAYLKLTGLDRRKDFDSSKDPYPGSSCLHALKFWRDSGIGGRRIDSFVGLRPGNREDVQQAIHHFGGAYVGLRLPRTACGQPAWKCVSPAHDPGANDPGSWCMHAVCAVAYNPKGLCVITWGFEQWMTWKFYETYSDEAYAVLSSDWPGDAGAPNGIDADLLKRRLEALHS